MSERQWKKQLPMIATYSRMVIAPVLFYLLYIDRPWSGVAAAIVFMIASSTDWLDGYWARKYDAQSNMGKLMDPIADKILVLGALVMLLYMQSVDPVMVFLLLSRDIFIGGLRSVAAANNVIISAKAFGKWKTAIQMMAVPCLFINQNVAGLPLGTIGYYALWTSVVLSIISAIQYTMGYYKGRHND